MFDIGLASVEAFQKLMEERQLNKSKSRYIDLAYLGKKGIHVLLKSDHSTVDV
jgi:hypothetical protein